MLRSIYRTPGLPVRIIVDEGYIIGYHTELEQACAVLRGFGGTLLVAFQSITQMQQLYPKTWPLFLSGDVVCFRPGTIEDAEWMSKRAGQETVSILSAAEPNSPNDLGPRPSWQQQRRDRYAPSSLFRHAKQHRVGVAAGPRGADRCPYETLPRDPAPAGKSES